jgi:Domain of Unknown Function with PDB structure (DUF3857)
MRFRFLLIYAGVVLLLSVLCATGAVAQKNTAVVQEPTAKYGKIMVSDFQKHPFPQDTTAEAVVLYELGTAEIEYASDRLWGVFTMYRRVAILKKSATDRGTISVPLYRRSAAEVEFIQDLEGATYTIDGTTIETNKLTKAGIVIERVSDNMSLHKFTLPNVREGSIIEYRYIVRTPFDVTHNPRSWAFQDKIPTVWSEYRATFPDSFYYKMLMNGYQNLAVSKKEDVQIALFKSSELLSGQRYRLAMQHIPALREEAYITTTSDYVAKIDFELASYSFPGQPVHNLTVGWEAMDRTLLDDADFGGQYKRAAFLRDAAKLLNANHPATDTMGRIEAACKVVSTAIKWDESNTYYSTNIKKAYEAKKGSTGDINLTLIALLREMGYNANPVVLSTRSHGRFNQNSALLKQFNYVVAHLQLGFKEILLDATDPYLAPGMLPLRAHNAVGRLILPDNHSRFIDLNPNERDTQVASGRFAIDEEGMITGDITHSFAGFGGYQARKKYRTDGETDYVASIKKERTNWQIDKVTFTGADNLNQAFGSTYSLSINEGVTVADDRLYFKPLLTEARTTNPFKESERLYPVDFGMLTDESYIATFTLPDGFVVEELPKPVLMSLPNNGGRFVFQATVSGNNLQVVSRLSLKKPIYFAEEYPALRELFVQVVAKHAEQVVLKKK